MNTIAFEYLKLLRDPMGVPFYPQVFEALMVLTFALHIIFVNLVIGTTGLSIWYYINRNDYTERLIGGFARASTIMTSLAIVLGVAPLLFVQVIYDPFWYTANNISAWWVLGFLLFIAISFTTSYLFYFSDKKGGNIIWAILSFVFLIIAGIVIHALSEQMISPEKWTKWITEGDKINLYGNKLHGINVVRFLHFIIPSFAVTGVFMMLASWYYRGKEGYSESYLNWLANKGRKMALIFSIIQGIVGAIWYALEIDVKGFALHPLTLLGILAGMSYIGYLMKLKEPEKRAIPTAIFTFMVILLMAITRETLRNVKLSNMGYSIGDYKLSLDWGSTVLFLLTFIMGIIVVSYIATIVYKLGKSNKKVTEMPELDTFGKIAVSLPVIWFIVVAGFGIILAFSNGALP
ncbi:MAG: hypothetical protein ACPLSJ_07280 [Thermosulfidibacteraceae bacterium]|jgi:hypothetical protein